MAAAGPRTHAFFAPSYVLLTRVDHPFVVTGTSMCVAERAAGRGLTAHVTGIAAGAVVAAAVVATARACAL